MEVPTPLLVMRGIAKRFGTTAALVDVSLDVFPGEVHALVGENGAGKSTLMKVLAGAERADTGSIAFAGEPFAPHEPLDSLRHGIAMIYQEFNLAPHLSVEANLMLGREGARSGFLGMRRWEGRGARSAGPRSIAWACVRRCTSASGNWVWPTSR
jgi:ribose transport system ATP-binding protein